MTFGASEVWLGGRPIQWRAESARTLFFYLLTYPSGQSREHVVEALWGVPCEAHAANRFRVAAHRVRRALGDPQAVVERHGRYSLSPEVFRASDVYQFHLHLNEAARADGPDRKLELVQSAMRLYQGAYLPDLEADWAAEARSILAQESATAQLEAARLLDLRGELEAATQALSAALRTDPYLGEQHHQDLIRKLARTEGKYAAVDYYRRFLHFLHAEVGDDPLPETVALVERIRRQPAGHPAPA